MFRRVNDDFAVFPIFQHIGLVLREPFSLFGYMFPVVVSVRLYMLQVDFRITYEWNMMADRE